MEEADPERRIKRNICIRLKELKRLRDEERWLRSWWTPVRVELPQKKELEETYGSYIYESEDVLVTYMDTSSGKRYIGIGKVLWKRSGAARWVVYGEEDYCLEVLAWMHLPEEYIG
jgi:hypothetical protein